MGRGDVKAPRAASVPARKVFETPPDGNLNSREIGSTTPSRVSPKRRCEIEVCSVRIEEVSIEASQTRGYPKFSTSSITPRNPLAYWLGFRHVDFLSLISSVSQSSPNCSTSGRSASASLQDGPSGRPVRSEGDPAGRVNR